MYAGIILLGIIFSGALERPWPFIIALTAIPVVWYWNRYDSPFTALISWWRKSPTTPTIGTPPAKKKWTGYLWNPLKSKFVLVIIAVVAISWLFSYRGQDVVKRGTFVGKGYLSSAISYTFEPKSLKETEVIIPGLVEGDYYIDVFSRKNIYTVKCPWEIGQRRRLFLREENVMTEPDLGNILVRGKGTPREYAVPPGGMVRIEESAAVIISFKGLPQNEIDGCQIASSTPVEIQFREDRG